ncbi:MAG: type II toxin-antitoxin system HicB family antitoxin [Chloroflexota bacterium]
MQIPHGFFKDGDTLPIDPDATAMDIGFIGQYRVIYTQYKGKWSADSPDVPGVFAGGDTREDAERVMREAIVFHLDEGDQVKARKHA